MFYFEINQQILTILVVFVNAIVTLMIRARKRMRTSKAAGLSLQNPQTT